MKRSYEERVLRQQWTRWYRGWLKAQTEWGRDYCRKSMRMWANDVMHKHIVVPRRNKR